MTNFDYSQDDLITGLKTIGIKENDIVLTYVSFGLLGRLKDADNSHSISRIILNSFETVLGKYGTLLVPTYTYSFCNNEKFVVGKTPSIIGPFTEFFRKQNRVIRSRDPIFSVAGIGTKASYLLSNLPRSCFGKDCIYDRLTKMGGKICMVGLGLQWATFRHYIEQSVGIPARYLKKFSGNIVENDKENYETWEYYVRKLDDNCYPDGRNLEKRVRELGFCKTAIVGRGEVSQIECKKFFDFGSKMLKKDPWFTAKGP